MEEVGFWEIYTMRKNMTSLWKWSLPAATLATLQMKYKVITIVQMQMSYRLQVAKKKGLIRQRNTKKNTIVNTTKRSSSKHTCVEFVEKLFPTALISKDTKNLKDVQKQKPMFSEISSY